MKTSRLQTSIAFFLGVASSACVFATMIPSEEVKLGSSDQTRLETRICGIGQKAELINARRVQTDPPTLSVQITCAPHGSIAGYQALKTGECEKTGRDWNCGPPVPAVRMRFHSEDLVLEYADDVTSSDAIAIAKFVSGVAGFKGQDVRVLLVGRCRISDGRTAPFPGAVNFNYECDGPRASLTRDCWKDRCRLFFTDFGIWTP